jgi:hypothetical protein
VHGLVVPESRLEIHPIPRERFVLANLRLSNHVARHVHGIDSSSGRSEAEAAGKTHHMQSETSKKKHLRASIGGLQLAANVTWTRSFRVPHNISTATATATDGDGDHDDDGDDDARETDDATCSGL